METELCQYVLKVVIPPIIIFWFLTYCRLDIIMAVLILGVAYLNNAMMLHPNQVLTLLSQEVLVTIPVSPICLENTLKENF